MEHSRGSSAIHEADVFGTEKDRINCPFYWKIGACRHGDKCSRNHNRPPFSQTILIPHMYPNPAATPMFDPQGNPVQMDKQILKEHFDDFYEDVFDELEKHGRVKELMICDNLCEHLMGNVYVKYSTEEEAAEALNKLNDRFYAGRLLKPEFSPVTDFEEAKCKDWDTDECTRGGTCNFMHLKLPSRTLTRELFGHDKFKSVRRSTRSSRGIGRGDDDRYYRRDRGSNSRHDDDDDRRRRRRRSGRRSHDYDRSSRSSGRRRSQSPGDRYYSKHRSRSPREMMYGDPYSVPYQQQQLPPPPPPQYSGDPYYPTDDRYYTYDHPPAPHPHPHEDASYAQYKRSRDEYRSREQQDPYGQYVVNDSHEQTGHKKQRRDDEYSMGTIDAPAGVRDGGDTDVPPPSHTSEQQQPQTLSNQ